MKHAIGFEEEGDFLNWLGLGWIEPGARGKMVEVMVVNAAGTRIRVTEGMREFVEFQFTIMDCSWQVGREGRAYCQFHSPCRPDCVRRLGAMLLWALTPGERVGPQIAAAAEHYARFRKMEPGYVFIRQIPRNGEEGLMIERVMLLGAEWVPHGFIALQ